MTTRRNRRDFLHACAVPALVALASRGERALAADEPTAGNRPAGGQMMETRPPDGQVVENHPLDDRTGESRPPDDRTGGGTVRVAAPDPLVTRMLQLAQVGASDTLVDLGSGDGRIAIAAARDFGARARGIDYDPSIIALARRNAEREGLSERVSFEQGDLLATDFSSADVVTMYLTPELTLRLRRTLLAMKPGTRIVSREFGMGDWEPEESSHIGLRSMHLWVVPANAGGEWKLRLAQGGGSIDATMTIRQRFQVLDGRVAIAGVETTMRSARVLGDQAHFAFTDTEGVLRIVDARIEPGRMIGAVATRDGDVAPFLAERVGKAPPLEGARAAPASTAPGSDAR